MKKIFFVFIALLLFSPFAFSTTYGHLRQGEFNTIYKFMVNKKGENEAVFSAKIHNFEKNSQLKCMKRSYYLDGPIFLYDKFPQSAGSDVGKNEKASKMLKKYPSVSKVSLKKDSSCGSNCTVYSNDKFKVRVRNGEVRNVEYIDSKLKVSENISNLVCEIFGEKPYDIAEKDPIERYGNWCGRGNNGKPPIDGVDEVCKVHDQCYDSKGANHCNCDVDFIKRMPSASASSPTGEAYKAGAIAVIGSKACFCEISWDSVCCTGFNCRRCRQSSRIWTTAVAGGC